MSRPADWRQRELARDPGRSCIVQAPAGAGKTELLTQRMLALLAVVEHPEEVVAITFTRKAAAEMGQRLVQWLRCAALARRAPGSAAPLEDHERVSFELAQAVLENDAARGWRLLEQPSRLRVRTIDSLCSELAHQLPVTSGLASGQQVAADAGALYRKAAVRTMAAIEGGPENRQADVIRILDRYDNQYDRLVELLSGMLASREQWLGHLLDARSGDGFDRQGLESALHYLVETRLEQARAATPDRLLRELPRYYRYAIANGADNAAELEALLAAGGATDADLLDLPASAGALGHWKTMIGGLLTAAGEFRRSAPTARGGFPAPGQAKGEEQLLRREWKDGFEQLLEEQRDNEAMREIFNSIRRLPSPDYDDEAWQSLESLMRLMLLAAANLLVEMAESGQVDFAEIANRAIQALGSGDAPSGLALRLDYRIRHLLVDEFQDTSASQIRLIGGITSGWDESDGHSLFLVGDPMQSIYRFRKAEVSLFIDAWEGRLFDHIRLQPLRLSVNFRSNTPVVDWVNRVFATVMPAHSNPVTGAVSYCAADKRPEAPGDGAVTVRILPQRDDAEEARQVAALIGRCDAGERVAILVRSRSHASAILAELDRLKADQPRYRYQAVKFIPLAETTLIRDLVSLTLALQQPADRLAWLASLRAPYVGLAMADLDSLVAGDAEAIIAEAAFAHGPDSTEPPPRRLSADARRRLQRAAPVLRQAVERRGRQSVRSLVESAWIELGGPACVENLSELGDAATYFDLLDTLADEDLPVDRDTLELRLRDLYAEPDSGASDRLQVLTIYEAKGLQFDRVILPGLHREPRGDEGKLLHWFELPGENRIVMSPMNTQSDRQQPQPAGNLVQFIALVEKQRQGMENGRLLYVAATRAVHSLHLFAAARPNARDEIKPGSASLLHVLWPAIEAEQAPLVRQAAAGLPAGDDLPDGDDAADTGPLPQDYRRLDAGWQLPALPAAVSAPPSEAAEAVDPIDFDWAGEDARLTGKLVHRLLQVIAERGMDSWQDGGGMARLESWCRAQLMGAGLRQAEAAAIIEDTARAVGNCLASEQGRWILGPRQEARCEYEITALIDRRPVNLVLDRTFVDGGVRWIVDYKTSSHAGGDLEAFLQSEAARYRAQLQRYRQALALTETRPIRTALYFPLLDRFLEVGA